MIFDSGDFDPPFSNPGVGGVAEDAEDTDDQDLEPEEPLSLGGRVAGAAVLALGALVLIPLVFVAGLFAFLAISATAGPDPTDSGSVFDRAALISGGITVTDCTFFPDELWTASVHFTNPLVDVEVETVVVQVVFRAEPLNQGNVDNPGNKVGTKKIAFSGVGPGESVTRPVALQARSTAESPQPECAVDWVQASPD